MSDKKIILASGSPRRRELLAQIGMEFEVRVSHAEEKAEADTPSDLVKALSRLKAEDIWQSLTGEEREYTLVIGADTVVAFENHVMGKPKNPEDACRMLTMLQGRTHQVYTGVTLVCKEGTESFFEETLVTMYPMMKEEISAYVSTGEPMDKAGAYGIQGRFAAYIKGISGDYNNVVGLPVGRVYQEIKKI